MQEEFEKNCEYCLNSFTCSLGRSIPDYDGLSKRLQVEFDVQKMTDHVKAEMSDRGVIIMSRLKELRAYVNAELNIMENEEKRISAIAHLYGVSLAATMIAKKRGLDWEIASMAAMLHDLYAYKSGSYDDHAHKGADLAREILSELNLTDEEETETICSAIYHHDDKLVTDGPMDEVLKDADVIHHCMNDLSKSIKDKEQARYDKLCREFSMCMD